MYLTDFGPHSFDMLGICPGETVHFNLAASDPIDKRRKKRPDGTPYGDWENADTGGRVFEIRFHVGRGASFPSPDGEPVGVSSWVSSLQGPSPHADNVALQVDEGWDGNFINVSGYVSDEAPSLSVPDHNAAATPVPVIQDEAPPLSVPDSGYRNDPAVSKSWSFAPRIGDAPTSIELVGDKQFRTWHRCDGPDGAGFSYRLGPQGTTTYGNQTVTESFSDSGGDFSVPGDLNPNWLNATDVPLVITRDENGNVINIDSSQRDAVSQLRHSYTTVEQVMSAINSVPANEGTFVADENDLIGDTQAGFPNPSVWSQAAKERGFSTWFTQTFKSCGQVIGQLKVTRCIRLDAQTGQIVYEVKVERL